MHGQGLLFQFFVRVRFHIIRNARIENVAASQSRTVSKLRMVWKQTVGGIFACGRDLTSVRLPGKAYSIDTDVVVKHSRI